MIKQVSCYYSNLILSPLQAMDSKMHRYMQRIEKLISTPTRTVSPIRPNKSPFKCRTNQLDQYLKYELSVKIITNFLSKHHEALMYQFFNAVRRSDYRQKERIYKFVAIEKKQVKVDLGIASKIMISAVKQVYKKRFTHFLQQIQLICFRQPVSVKTSKDQPIKSPNLIKTYSRPSQRNYQDISQFDLQSVKGRQTSEKTDKIKKYVAKALLRFLKQKIGKNYDSTFRKIHHKYLIAKENKKYESQISLSQTKATQSWLRKEEAFKKQIQNLEQTLQKTNTFSMRSTPRKSKPSESHFQECPQIKDNLRQIQCLCEKGGLIKKSQLLTQLKIILYLAAEKKRCLQIIKQKLQRSHKKTTTAFLIGLFLTKKMNFYLNNFFKNLQFASIQIKGEPLCLTQGANDPIPLQIPQSCEIAYPEDSVIPPQMLKINFYSFMDKLFRLILIVSKLLIPMKEAFVKIDLYASYSYRIQESFKVIYQNRLRPAFDTLKACPLLEKPNKGGDKIVTVLGHIVREKYIEAFSYIKILSKQRQLKVQVSPVKRGVIESAKIFLQERNIYSIYSLDYWGKVQENQYQELGNPEKQSIGRRSNTIL